MVDYWWVPAAIVAITAVVFATGLAVQHLRRRKLQQALEATRKEFFRRREWLEARYVTLASEFGPRGLNWVNCDFDNEVRFARDRDSGALRAFVAVTIQFEAIEGGGMEDVEAVGNLRAATAVFLHGTDGWTTEGRTIYNLNPHEAIARFHQQLETVD